MDNAKLVLQWRSNFVSKCEDILARELTDAERVFIESRGGFMALESIENTVDSLDRDELIGYLNSEGGEVD